MQATVHGVAKSRARLSDFTFIFTLGFIALHGLLLWLAGGYPPLLFVCLLWWPLCLWSSGSRVHELRQLQPLGL